jgi:hypothetical protein
VVLQEHTLQNQGKRDRAFIQKVNLLGLRHPKAIRSYIKVKEKNDKNICIG